MKIHELEPHETIEIISKRSVRKKKPSCSYMQCNSIYIKCKACKITYIIYSHTYTRGVNV